MDCETQQVFYAQVYASLGLIKWAWLLFAVLYGFSKSLSGFSKSLSPFDQGVVPGNIEMSCVNVFLALKHTESLLSMHDISFVFFSYFSLKLFCVDCVLPLSTFGDRLVFLAREFFWLLLWDYFLRTSSS